MGRKKKIQTGPGPVDSAESVNTNDATDPGKPDVPATEPETKAPPVKPPADKPKDNRNRIGFVMSVLPGLDADADAADMARDAFEYADAMIAAGNNDALRNTLASASIANIVRAGETSENAAKQAFLIADEIIALK